MMQVVGDVKCYHCGHVSGQIEGERTNKLVLKSFKPRPGFQGEPPRPGQRIRCERCGGPVFLEELRPVLPGVEPVPLAVRRAARKRKRPSKAA
jgi:DNA-directed RNA polymerase subunit RPC12/RpoP